MCLYNIRSLANQLTLFQSLIYSSNFDIICIMETWLTDSHYDSEIFPTNGNIFSKDRKLRGGVLIAVRDLIPVKEIPTPEDLENCMCSITN